jgi:DNA-binding HxlR family transcriptional regulator
VDFFIGLAPFSLFSAKNGVCSIKQFFKITPRNGLAAPEQRHRLCRLWIWRGQLLKAKSADMQLDEPSVTEKLHPYVVFLPKTEKKDKILSAIFGSKAGVDILRFSLKQGVAKNIYQKDLVKTLNYSNKTIIENLKTLTKLGVLNESMEKNDKEGRIIWIKAYQLTNLGKWFALLIAEEKELPDTEKAEILQSLFRTYVKQVKRLAEEIGINKKMLEETFREEMKSNP